jgi:FAD/FMN-containing dehydrogenase
MWLAHLDRLAKNFVSIIAHLGTLLTNAEQAIGSESCVGMIGATLGGGVGRYNGLHGMLLDSLLSVKMVTAAGQITTVSSTQNPDLFWGIRGAGFNYGTILEATYSIYDETAPLVLNADFIFQSNASETILSFFKSFEQDLPAKLSLILLATYDPTMGGVSYSSHKVCFHGLTFPVNYLRQCSLCRPPIGR